MDDQEDVLGDYARQRSLNPWFFSMRADEDWLNELWNNAPDVVPVEACFFITPMGNHLSHVVVRKFSRIEFIGRVKYFTDVNLYVSHEVLVTRKQASGMGAAQIVSLGTEKMYGKNMTFSLPLLECRLRYRANDAYGGSVLSLEWTGSIELSSNLSMGLEDYYSKRKKIEVFYLPRPSHSMFHDVEIEIGARIHEWDRYFYVRQGSANPLGESVQRRENLSSQPGEGITSKDPAVPPELTALLTEMYFPGVASGHPPVDIGWISNLVTPPHALEFNRQVKDDDRLTVHYKKSRIRHSSQDAQSAAVGHLTPLVRIYAAGDQAERLFWASSRSYEMTWDLTGDAGGKLVGEGSNRFYQPGLKPAGINYGDSGETMIPAITRASYARLPAQVDTVTAVRYGEKRAGSYVTTFAYPTHFIRLVALEDGLYLRCCYYNVDNIEKEVPADAVEWHILVGNGHVSREGRFSPSAYDPSIQTTVVGVDTRNVDEWRFAITIVPHPLLPVRDLMQLQDE